MGMNGCAAIYPALMAVTIANMSGTPMDLSFYGMLLVIIVISSLGIAGLPGTATMAVSVVISGMINVNGTMVTAVTVANSLDSIDRDIYNK